MLKECPSCKSPAGRDAATCAQCGYPEPASSEPSTTVTPDLAAERGSDRRLMIGTGIFAFAIGAIAILGGSLFAAGFSFMIGIIAFLLAGVNAYRSRR